MFPIEAFGFVVVPPPSSSSSSSFSRFPPRGLTSSQQRSGQARVRLRVRRTNYDNQTGKPHPLCSTAHSARNLEQSHPCAAARLGATPATLATRRAQIPQGVVDVVVVIVVVVVAAVGRSVGRRSSPSSSPPRGIWACLVVPRPRRRPIAVREIRSVRLVLLSPAPLLPALPSPSPPRVSKK